MDESTKATFAKLDGTPAHILVILGLFLMLLAPLIMNFKAAGVAKAGAAAEQSDDFMRLDMKEFTDKQDEEKKKDETASFEDRQKHEQERQKAYDDKQRELKNKYNAVATRREFLEASADFVGMRIHYIATFLGALCLLIGLIVMTVQASGTTQKVLLIILLVVMFSALSGINLNIEGRSNLGGSRDAMRSIMDAMPRPTPPPSRP